VSNLGSGVTPKQAAALLVAASAIEAETGHGEILDV
jgi:hypothetical protein